LSHILTLNAVLFLVNKINIKIDWVVLAIAMVGLSVLSGLIFYLLFERRFNFMYKNVFKKRFLFRKVI
ncbi:hypothetical protein, partial [Rosenbergiella epipactidis]|uniref:hypothetical protein n=1 Tax=Rosenbergiella epipactidis TaxID=1544694 RepID=UPI001F4DDDD1